MPLVKLLKGAHVSLSRALRQGVIRGLCLSIGWRHVFVYLGKRPGSRNSPLLVRHDYHVSAVSSERHLFLRHPLYGCELPGVLNAGVMPRFERVVALPDLKISQFPRPHQHLSLHGLSATGLIGTGNGCDRPKIRLTAELGKPNIRRTCPKSGSQPVAKDR